MKMKRLVALMMLLFGLSFGGHVAHASSGAKAVFDGEYPGNTTSCFVCHTGTPGSLTAYGTQYVGAGGFSPGTLSAIQAIDASDADNDGTSNGAEIAAGTDPNGGAATGANTEQASVTGCVASSFTTPLTMVLVMLSLGYFVRRKKD